MKIKAYAFIDEGSSAEALLSAEGFLISADDEANGVNYAEAEANDVVDALGLCERFREADVVGGIIYKGKDYSSEEFFEKDFSDAELGLV